MTADPRIETIAQALWLAEEERTHRLARRMPWSQVDQWNKQRYLDQATKLLAWSPAAPIEPHDCPDLAGRPLYGYLPRVEYLVGVRKPRGEYWLGPLAHSLEAAKTTMREGDPKRGVHEPWRSRDVIGLVSDSGLDVAIWSERPDREPLHLCDPRP